MTKEDEQTIRNVLKSVEIFRHITPEETDVLITGFEKTPMKKGDIIITQGLKGLLFYIIASGKVGVYLKRRWIDKQVATLVAGQYFGEMAIINDEPRSATVKCEEDGEVFTLLRETFYRIIMNNAMVFLDIKNTATKRQRETNTIQMDDNINPTRR